MILILEKIAPLFIIMGLGYVLNKCHVLVDELRHILRDMLVCVTCPCMIIVSMISIEFDREVMVIAVSSIGLAVVLFTLTPFIGVITGKILGIKDREALAAYAYSFGPTNSGFFGFPVSAALFGADIMFVFVMQNIVLSYGLYMYGIIMLHVISGKGRFNKGIVISALKNPCVIASFVGLILMVCNVSLPGVILSSMTLIGDCTTTLAMLLVGIMIAGSDYSMILKDWRFALMTVAKMTLVPFIAFLVVNWLPVPVDVKVGLPFAFGFPVAVMVGPMMEREGHDPSIATALIASTALISVITLPMLASLLSGFYNYGM